VFPLISALGFVTGCVLVSRRTEHRNQGYGLFMLSLVGLLFLNQVRVRSDLIHLFPNAMIGLLLVPALFSLGWAAPLGRRLGLGLLAIALLAAFKEPVMIKKHMFRLDYLYSKDWSAIARAGHRPVEKEVADLISFIQTNTAENEPIYVGVKNHDQFIGNDVILYFLAGRPCPTRYHELHPGVTNTREVQQEIIDDLQRGNVRLVVLIPRFWPEPNESAVDAGIDLLDDFITTQFQLTATFGSYEVWTPKKPSAVSIPPPE
jgi:hypothetical protein